MHVFGILLECVSMLEALSAGAQAALDDIELLEPEDNLDDGDIRAFESPSLNA